MSAIIDPKNRKFQMLAVGTEIAGVRIVKHVTPNATRTADCIYLAQFLCCGRRHHLTHKRIVLRHSHGRKSCKACSRRLSSRWTNADVAAAQAMRSRGQSCAKIGAALGIPETTIAGWCG